MTALPASPSSAPSPDDAPIRGYASGPAPYRALVVGRGPIGDGDRSTMVEGFAQRLAARTGHGVEAEATGDDPLAHADPAEVLAGRDLRRHDAVVLVVDPRRDVQAAAERLLAVIMDLQDRMTVGAAVIVVVSPTRPSARPDRDLDRFAELVRSEAGALTPVVRLDVTAGLTADERTARWTEAVADVAADALIDPLVRSIPDDPFDEFERSDVVRAVGRRYVDWAEAFQDVVDAARSTYGTPSAAMSIIDDDTTHYFARSGNVADELPRGKTVCNRVMRIYGGLIMGDARLDDRFSRLPEVRSGDVRFYAGYRVTGPDGAPFGALCVFDSAVREVDEADLVRLRDLALDAQRRLWALLAA